MAKSKTRSSSSRARNRKRFVASCENAVRWLMQREVWGLGVTAFGALTVISLLSQDQGTWSRAWSLLLRQIFGIGAYPVAFLILTSGIALLVWTSIEHRVQPRWQLIIGCEIIFFAGLGLIHALSPESSWVLAEEGRRGGYIGWAAVRLLVPILGNTISTFLLALLIAGGLLLATGTSWQTLIWRLGWLWAQIGVRLRTRILESRRRRALRPAPASVNAMPETTSPTRQPSRATRVSSTVQPTYQPAAQVTKRRSSRKRSTRLPPLDLLVPDLSDVGDDADARMRSQIIQETLQAFGVPAQVVEWRRGPVVTQFSVVPGYVERLDRDGDVRRHKVRVSKILSLSNDLALALAASPIRIEAPVPGRAVVGIEVPNAEKSVVGLRGVLESSTFRKAKGSLRLALGRDVSGQPVVADLSRMPHLLLAGATGSGKSACLNAALASLLFYNTPDQVHLLLVDPKRVELTRFNGIPHLIAPVVVDAEKVIVALRWIVREMEHRYELLAKAHARDLDGYNRIRSAKGLDPLPKIVVVVDELADVMLASPDEVERTLCRIAQMARATGIHLVIATQRPSVDVVTGLIKANFPSRISFAVTSQVDSRVVLDVPGAEKLLGRGDMLYMAPDVSELRRIQGCWVSEDELDALVLYWKQTQSEVAEAPEPPPWEGMSLEKESADRDDLLQQAVDLVRKHEQASASFLQRQMRIGYPRAARLIDELERQGIVGPQESGGRSRVVIKADEAIEDLSDDSTTEEPAGETG